MKIETTILVQPAPKGRPRTIFKGGRFITFTPTKTEQAETQIRLQLQHLEDRLNQRLYFEKDVPIRLEVTFYRVRPVSAPRRVSMPTAAPDFDNYAKLLTDAIEKFFYHSDSQITTAIIRKRFGVPPRIELKLEEDK